MRGFRYHSTLGQVAEASLRGTPFLIDDSITVVIGDAVTINGDGHIALCTSSDERPVGIVTGFIGPNGQITDPATGFTDRYTTEDDNTTDKLVKALILDGRENLYIVDFDASLAQTNIGQFFDLNNSYEPDVGSASDTDGLVQLIELDPEQSGDDSFGLIRIAEHFYRGL